MKRQSFVEIFRLQAKQARAERQRLEYQTERAKKIHQLLARVEEVKVIIFVCHLFILFYLNMAVCLT